MFNIIFYKDKNGNSDIINYLDELQEKAKTDKSARINREKILAYMAALAEYGTRIGTLSGQGETRFCTTDLRFCRVTVAQRTSSTLRSSALQNHKFVAQNSFGPQVPSFGGWQGNGMRRTGRTPIDVNAASRQKTALGACVPLSTEGKPFVKHIDGNLWELRPLSNRIFFFYWKDDQFVLVHYYLKRSQKAPKKEIEKARRNIKDYLERCGEE